MVERTTSNQGPSISFYRRSELAGVEVRTLRNSQKLWYHYCTEYEFFAPSSWRGEIWHRRRAPVVAPGFLLCAHPGEVFSVERVLVPGSASALTFDATVLADYASEHELTPDRLRLRGLSRMSNGLLTRLFEVFTMVRPGPTAMELQSSIVEFVAALARELLDESTSPPSRVNPDSQTAARIRECLHADPSATLDLSTLAQRIGMSRFRILRVFKRRYGLPPHAYQLQLRLGLAQRSLREGLRPAEVAAEYGFVDQSHLTRHFKRLVGVTPAQYARVPSAAPTDEPVSVPSLEG